LTGQKVIDSLGVICWSFELIEINPELRGMCAWISKKFGKASLCVFAREDHMHNG
jgi:hypothetical protein